MQVPEHYRVRVGYVEHLLMVPAMECWLRGEFDETSPIVGSRDDDPVSAVMNLYPYLKPDTKDMFRMAINSLVLDWITVPDGWVEKAAFNLLHTAEEIGSQDAKDYIVDLSKTAAFEDLPGPSQSAALGVVAKLTEKGDFPYWRMIAAKYPRFEAFAFQVMYRISEPDALDLLLTLKLETQELRDGVERRYPSFREHLANMGRSLAPLPS